MFFAEAHRTRSSPYMIPAPPPIVNQHSSSRSLYDGYLNTAFLLKIRAGSMLHSSSPCEAFLKWAAGVSLCSLARIPLNSSKSVCVPIILLSQVTDPHLVR